MLDAYPNQWPILNEAEIPEALSWMAEAGVTRLREAYSGIYKLHTEKQNKTYQMTRFYNNDKKKTYQVPKPHGIC